MNVFVDTSAFYALLDRDDRNHDPANDQFDQLRRQNHHVVTHNYVIVETTAILQNRLGMEAVADFTDKLIRPVSIGWIDRQDHESAMNACLATRTRQLSFIDHVSFQFMRQRDVESVFGFDRDFEDKGFHVIP